ncbi:(d)CMP kinase [Coraliomargarita sinensis]|uniref:Cytidylate kinase n=1 Tax=Coraliomargarita sinensis TaxID=2174842 RepID=A0A317ZNS8_9BACT|nr:(d)CMP kinase [Coraliomargarita sinensis]PXA05538.1 (d)CMP kinase [Coraliomargarita sinensis]
MPALSSEFKIIAIDGGAAVGKSSTSKGLAERLDLMHVDTGAHYRTITFALLATGASPEDDLQDTLAALDLKTHLDRRTARLCIDGRVPTEVEIRSPEVNASVSKFAAIPAVRQSLFEYQRNQANVGREEGFRGLIMEGRDIGSIIFPDAQHRFFLEADEATRAARRAKEGQTDSIADRDKMDKARKTAPLVCPEGAIRVDTGPRSLEEVIEHIINLIGTGNTSD